MRKILKNDDLPLGFIYFTETHIVEGTGKNYNEKVLMKHEGIYKEKGNKVVIHCRHWEKSNNGEKKTKNAVGV